MSGHPIDTWLDPSGVPWGVVDDRLAAAGVANAQVQVAWVMLPDRNPFPLAFPSEQQAYKEKLATVVRALKVRFPNLDLAYLSSHSYTGYADEHANLEPIANQHGFGVKWLIEDQIEGVGNLNPNPAAGPVVAPWLAWGPYTWANGLGPDGMPGGQPGRADGLEWACSDFTTDGIHPSPAGKAKEAAMLLSHFTSAPTSCPWFLAGGLACGTHCSSDLCRHCRVPLCRRHRLAGPDGDHPGVQAATGGLVLSIGFGYPRERWPLFWLGPGASRLAPEPISSVMTTDRSSSLISTGSPLQG